ncbi:somatostatin 2 [Tachysurus fulvidraco]|uniref:somatostatin 2 n=1 Tax=Tachysurus fulvidraco TaxID=1234273 RepID=UPI000F4F416B|nr:somatostatin 2 [Tachysurus fulvidraco]
MSSSPLRLALALMCLVSAVGVVSCGRPHVILSSALEDARNIPLGEEVPERLTLPELQWMLSNNELTPVQVEEAPHSRMELVRRDNTATTKPVNCMNYFWKSRTAC